MHQLVARRTKRSRAARTLEADDPTPTRTRTHTSPKLGTSCGAAAGVSTIHGGRARARWRLCRMWQPLGARKASSRRGWLAEGLGIVWFGRARELGLCSSSRRTSFVFFIVVDALRGFDKRGHGEEVVIRLRELDGRHELQLTHLKR